MNRDWTGSGDTRLASKPEKEFPNAEDLIAFKQELIAGLPEDERQIQARSFQLVTDWIAALPETGGSGR